jgi:hypothetical protein
MTTPLDRHFRVRALQEPTAKVVVPQVEAGVNPHEGLTQSHMGQDMQDPQRGQIVQVKAILL